MNIPRYSWCAPLALGLACAGAPEPRDANSHPEFRRAVQYYIERDGLTGIGYSSCVAGRMDWDESVDPPEPVTAFYCDTNSDGTLDDKLVFRGRSPVSSIPQDEWTRAQKRFERKILQSYLEEESGRRD